MEADEVLEWRYYLTMEPRLEDRADFHSAQITQAIYTFMQSFGGTNNKIKMEDCLLKFSDENEEDRLKRQSLKNAQIIAQMFGNCKGNEKLKSDMSKINLTDKT